jgi:hypothetical protein
MKTKLLIGLFAIGLLAFNFSLKSEGESEKGIALQNVAVMQANAGEMWCDQINDQTCTIQSPDGYIGTSTGRLICTF